MKTNFPIVTVLLPTYNCEAYVRESIQSILDQTFTDFELVIIDDASTDGTVQIIKEFDDSRICLIQKDKNTGYTDSLNHGIDLAKGVYIARMDADDISVPSRLEKQVNFLENHKDVVLCGSWYQEIPTQHIAQLPCSQEAIKVGMLTSNVICHPSVVFRKDFFIQHQLYYNRDFEPAEDYELWTRLIVIGKINNLPEVLIHYRLHAQQVSEQRNAHQRKHAAFARKKLLQYLTPIPPDEDALLERILSETRLDTIPELHKAIAILEKLDSFNSSKGFFERNGFAAFIEQEKKMVIRNFFIFHSHYNLRMLQCFYRLKDGRRHLTRSETARLICKCLLLWQIKN